MLTDAQKAAAYRARHKGEARVSVGRVLPRKPKVKIPSEIEPLQSLDVVTTAAGRRTISEHSPAYFDSYYCGMRWAAHRERWLSTLATLRSETRAAMRKVKLLLLAPRDHGKTESGITFVTREIVRDRNVRILWIAEAAVAAKKRVRRVKRLLQSAKIQEDWCSGPDGTRYGPLRVTADDKWTESMIYVHRQIESVDPTLEAVGAGGTVTGGHFDIIVIDDLETDRSTYTAAEREKTRAWLKGTIYPMLVRGGLLVTIGTRKHHDDAYAHMLKDPTFRVIKDPAIVQWPRRVDPATGKELPGWAYTYGIDTDGRRICTGVEVLGPSEVLWPEERPIDYLLLEREGSSPSIFAREFQHEVQDDSTALIRWAWLERAWERGAALSYYERPPDLRDNWLDTVNGWDLSLVTDKKHAEQHNTDYTVGVGWAKDLDGNRFLVGLHRERGVTPARHRTVMVKEYKRLETAGMRPRVVPVEHNNFGELVHLGIQKTTDLPLRKHVTTGDKKADVYDGVPALAALFENDKVVLPSKTDEDKELSRLVMNELWGIGKEAHDDIPMALWISELQHRKGTFRHRVAVGANDIDEIEDGRFRPDDTAEPGTPENELEELAKDRLARQEQLTEREKRDAELLKVIEGDGREAPEVWGEFPFFSGR